MLLNFQKNYSLAIIWSNMLNRTIFCVKNINNQRKTNSNNYLIVIFTQKFLSYYEPEKIYMPELVNKTSALGDFSSTWKLLIRSTVIFFVTFSGKCKKSCNKILVNLAHYFRSPECFLFCRKWTKSIFWKYQSVIKAIIS